MISLNMWLKFKQSPPYECFIKVMIITTFRTTRWVKCRIPQVEHPCSWESLYWWRTIPSSKTGITADLANSNDEFLLFALVRKNSQIICNFLTYVFVTLNLHYPHLKEIWNKLMRRFADFSNLKWKVWLHRSHQSFQTTASIRQKSFAVDSLLHTKWCASKSFWTSNSLIWVDVPYHFYFKMAGQIVQELDLNFKMFFR